MSESENLKVKQSLQNISCFNKDTVFVTRKKQTIDNIMYYWVKSPLAVLNELFSRSELFALKSIFFLILLVAMQ